MACGPENYGVRYKLVRHKNRRGNAKDAPRAIVLSCDARHGRILTVTMQAATRG
jgi:hypothetical protein